MSDSVATAGRVAARWFPGGATVTPLGTAGLSGSPVFLVSPRNAPPHVLKGFSVGTTRQRAEWVHGIIRGLRHAGCLAIPAIREHAPGQTLAATADGRLWEMMASVEGRPVDGPSRPHVTAAMEALARIHAAAATLPHEPPRLTCSRAVTERIERARRLGREPWRALLHAPLPRSRWHSAVMPRLARACDAFDAWGGVETVTALAAMASRPLLCQFALRDVWSEHVLFDHPAHDHPDDPVHVAGIIDWHAAGIDTPATDIARLLGSWMPGDGQIVPTWWDFALDAYEAVRPLGGIERPLVSVLAASGVLLGLDNWFRWTLLEDRGFADQNRVVARIDRLLESLPAALECED